MAYKPVTALFRGLLLLELTNAHGPAGLTQLQRLSGLPKPTTLRMLETLRRDGYVSFDSTTHTYQVALRSVALSNSFVFDNYLMNVAKPTMQKLRKRLGWPSDLAVFQHDKMVIIDTNREPGALSANRAIGSRIPIMASATGRAYLANTSEQEQKEIETLLKSSSDPYEKLAKDTEMMHQIIRETRARGYAISDREFLPSNRGAAVPVMVGDKVQCVINLIAIASIVSIKTVIDSYVPLLFEAKFELETKLSWSS